MSRRSLVLPNDVGGPKKVLSYSAILALAANTMNGPGITTLPDVAADAGLALFVVLIGLSVAMTAFVCRRMVHAMWSWKGDAKGGGKGYGSAEAGEGRPLLSKDMGVRGEDWQPPLDKTSIVGQSLEAYGGGAKTSAALTMVATALALALAQMMLCAAILDGMFVAVGGKSCAVGLPSEDHASWIYCTSQSSMKPYEGSGAPQSLVSIGWVIAATGSVAMGTVDLDEMMAVQYFLFGCLVVASVRFSAVLLRMSGDLPPMDDVDGGDAGGGVSWLVGPSPFATIGSIVFNFAFVVTSPPSSAMARSEKIAYGALGVSCAVMGALYSMVGLCGAAVSVAVRGGLVEGGNDSNLLSLILLSGGEDGASYFDLCMIGLFGFSTVASIPVYCLLAKETLVSDAGVAPLPSFLLSNVLPWILVAAFYNSPIFAPFVDWSGLLVLGYSNFSLPLVLDMKLIHVRALGEKVKDSLLTKGVFWVVTLSITVVIIMKIFF